MIDDYAHGCPQYREEVTQVGQVPGEAELIDDAHECTRDRDEQRILDPVVNGEGQVSIPDPVLVRMLLGAPAHGASAKIFALAGKPVVEILHIGEATVVPAFHCFPRLGLENE